MIEHILRSEAFGGNFFPADLKFLNEIQLVWNGNFSVMVNLTIAENDLKCSQSRGLQDAETILQTKRILFF